MNKVQVNYDEMSLDPEDWEKTRRIGHKMLDDMIDHQQEISKLPYKPTTTEAVEDIRTRLSEGGDGEEAVYEVFKRSIYPYLVHNDKPKFWGGVAGTGSPYGMLAMMLTAGVNAGIETIDSSGVVHKQVIDWIKELLGYPSEAGGVLVSGGLEANFTGLAVARNAMAKVDMKAKGMQDVPKKMTLYVSDGGHHCLERSVELLGIGGDNLRWVPSGGDYRMDISALKETIRKDREAGYYPFCLIGNAGSVDTGAFDDFNSLADLAKKERMWFHVDGVFGCWVKLSETHRHLADGIERADSLAVDLHKWMYMPYGIGCTLVKDRLAHYSTFVYGHEAQYLKTAKDMAEAHGDSFSNAHNLALPLSREFRSLKVYMLLRANGKEKYSQLIQKNLDQASYLAGLVEKDKDLELMAPVASNVVCLRYNPGGLSEQQLDNLNKSIANGLNAVSFWMLSDTTVKGRFTLRAAITNHRSRRSDFDYVVSLVKELGAKAAAKGV